MDGSIDDMGGEERASSSARRATLRPGAARQVAINFLPSRQLPHNTLRLRRNRSEHEALLAAAAGDGDAERQADLIVREMAQKARLMEDDPGAEELRREALRDLPEGLTMKRSVRAKLSATVSRSSKHRPISLCKRLKYRLSFAWKRTGDRLREFIFSVELWYEAIRNIEGHFGSAVGSYFYFLRFMFVLNVVLTVFMVSFVVLPQALHDQAANGTAANINILDFITGEGYLQDSLLFYGHYHDGYVVTQGPTPSYYSMPFAYFFTVVCLYVVFFAVLCFRTAYSYRRHFIAAAGGSLLAARLLCGWDFGIVSPAAARLHATSIHNELKEILAEQNKQSPVVSRCGRYGRYVANALAWVVVAAACGGAAAAARGARARGLAAPAAVTAVLAAAPLLLTLLVKIEFYKPRTAFYVTLARVWLVDIGALIVILLNWLQSGLECWETLFGQETYRLVVFDAAVSLFLLPVIEFIRALIYKMHGGQAPEFNIAYNSLTIIYNQALLWFGMLFSPLLVVVVTFKFLLLFYIKRVCALKACQPARKVWRAAQTQTLLYMLVTLSLFTTLFVVGTLFLGESSQACGPFRGYSAVYGVLTDGVLDLTHHESLRAALRFLTRPGLLAFVAIFLGVLVYYTSAQARAQRSMVALLRRMLLLQAKDKDFLLAAIARVSNGEWLYSPKESGEGDDSHTWRYLREVRQPSNAGFHLDASRLSHPHRDRPTSMFNERRNSGDTDTSFSYKGSTSNLNRNEMF